LAYGNIKTDLVEMGRGVYKFQTKKDAMDGAHVACMCPLGMR
jgi:hypothetical protein